MSNRILLDFSVFNPRAGFRIFNGYIKNNTPYICIFLNSVLFNNTTKPRYNMRSDKEFVAQTNNTILMSQSELLKWVLIRYVNGLEMVTVPLS